MNIIKLGLIILFGLSILILPSCADYEDYTYTTSNDPAEPIEAMPKRLKLFSEGYFGIFADLIPVSVLWDVDTEMHYWSGNEDVNKITTDTFEGIYTWTFEGTNGTWMGIGISVLPSSALKDLSIYSNGHFNFAVKATNLFKAGMKTTLPDTEAFYYANTTLSNYGLRLDGTWCEISIPFTDIKADYPNFNLANTELYFMFASDPALNYSVGNVYFVDNLHLTKE
ncbi:MAG: hypothetical protein KAS64_06345 [Spirochaetes bacterium]|nr:hypothetical protein [Spirochaetota bacterium]